MSLDDLRTAASGAEAEAPVRRVDRPSPMRDKVTRAEELRLQLADEIVRGVLPPGSALDETDIARRFSVSRTPVREALRQLVASGLVESRAHRGAVVAQPSPDRLTEMFEAMAELEALCAGLAAERMPPGDRQRLEAIHDELRVLSHAGNPERFHAVNERFHNAIYAGSQNGYIAEMTLATRVRVQPFRRAQFRNLGRLARRLRCVRISSWCAGNTSFTRCRCKESVSVRSPDAALPDDALRPLGCTASGTRRRSNPRFLRHERAPAAERRDVARAFDRHGLHHKALHASSIREPYRADPKRRRDGGDEFAERCRRQCP
jgi:DNA-binding GntR family transcriptional regulator